MSHTITSNSFLKKIRTERDPIIIEKLNFAQYFIEAAEVQWLALRTLSDRMMQLSNFYAWDTVQDERDQSAQIRMSPKY